MINSECIKILLNIFCVCPGTNSTIEEQDTIEEERRDEFQMY